MVPWVPLQLASRVLYHNLFHLTLELQIEPATIVTMYACKNASFKIHCNLIQNTAVQ